VKKPKTERSAKLRVISGRWRRRSLPVANVPGLRPTGDRVRETLFNWLMHHVNGAHCLDLFAGTGALGIEALSRGASFVHFVEKSREAARILQQNLVELDAERSSFSLFQDSAQQFIAQYSGPPFDLIFIDPPFAENLWKSTIAQLIDAKLLQPKALIYLESPNDAELALPADWPRLKHLKAGNITCQLLENTSST
jgi:16S rRNA (guanine966-N2)-methyltransferase